MSRTRYALYFVPAPGSVLAAFGTGVLGVDSADGREVPRLPALDGIEAVTAAPRVYGFHATLAAPLRLAPGVEEGSLVEAVEAIALRHPCVPAGPLQVALIGAFVALVPAQPAPAVDLLAAECVAALDPLRAPLSEEERAKRRPERLDPRRRALLERWGYPHVFEAFRFHMTLTDALPETEREPWRARLAEAFGKHEPLVIDALTLLRQEDGAPFRVLCRIPFGE